MNNLWPLGWVLLAVLLMPVIVYTCTKVAVYAFFKARQQLEQDYPTHMKEPNDDFKTGT